MDVAGLRVQLQKYEQEHLLAFWDDLSEEEKTLLFNELSQLDLEYVTQSFDRCVADLNAKAEKLDDCNMMYTTNVKQLPTCLNYIDGLFREDVN